MVDSVPLSVKWGKETIKFDLVVASGVKGLKTELEEKTGVPSDRMKIMGKSKGLWKGVLKDDFDLSTIDFASVLSKSKNEVQILLMGSAASLAGPKTKTVFLEDLPPEEIAKVKEPSGLANLGNTCYLNSVVQCLRAIGPVRKGLEIYSPDPSSAQSKEVLFVSALRDLFDSLDRSAEAHQPKAFVLTTKIAFPQFAQLGPRNQPMQQDAEEFFSKLLTVLSSEMNGKAKIEAGLATSVTDAELKGANNLVDAVFGLKMEETLTCDEFNNSQDESEMAEPPVISTDLQRKLQCSIQGGSDGNSEVNVNHISEGIKLSLEGKIVKRSETLGRDASWTRKQRISRLPPIIVVQFGRFYWKATPDSQDHAGVKCKVMKPVAFNGIFDVYDFCSEEIQAVLKTARDKALAAEEDKINKKLQGQDDPMKESQDDQEMATEDDEEATALKEALAMSMETEQDPVGPGLPQDFQGLYELFATVTHKGRDADGGHYMAWVKAEKQFDAQKIMDTDDDNEDWFVFDDDEVNPCKTEDVLKLKGGGDWHMSYLNFYRAKK